jgi:hypothetical protein
MNRPSFTVVLLALTISVPAGATIIDGSVTGGTALTAGGTFVKLPVSLTNPFGPANSVGNDNFQSPNLFGFDEDQNILLTAPLIVDVGTSPIPRGYNGGVISIPMFSQSSPVRQTWRTAIFGHTGVHYVSPYLRLEAGDSVAISGPRQILFDTVASSAWRLCPGPDRILARRGDCAGAGQPGVVRKRADGAGGTAKPKEAIAAVSRSAPLHLQPSADHWKHSVYPSGS